MIQALRDAIAHVISEASHSGAGLGDGISEDGALRLIVAALGFKTEDVALLNSLYRYPDEMIDQHLDNEEWARLQAIIVRIALFVPRNETTPAA